jgi:hypothetical protein
MQYMLLVYWDEAARRSLTRSATASSLLHRSPTTRSTISQIVADLPIGVRGRLSHQSATAKQ